MIYWISMVIYWIVCTLFFPTRFIGKKNLQKGKCIWACNHTTNFDVLILGTKAFSRFYSLGKAELFKNRLMAWYFNKLGTISVQRGKNDIDAIKKSIRVLNEKQKPLLIFPTGTRESSPEEVQDLKNGVAMLAVKANAPIIPMVLVRKPVIFRPNRFVVGEPIDVSAYQGQKATREMYDEISQKVTQSMQDLLEKYSYKKDKKKREVKA